MSDFDWQQEPEIEWPTRVSGPLRAPGRESDIVGATVVEFDQFRRRRNQFVGELEADSRGSGDGGGGRGVIVDLPGETPPTDNCAYYVSFRYGIGWGIHIGLDCWFRLARFLWLNGVSADVAVDEAFLQMYRHEDFHFAVDKAVLLLERAVGASTGNCSDHWIPYMHANNPSWLEEALANANAHHFAGTSRNKVDKPLVKRLIGAWMKRMPPGYRDFDRFHSMKAKDRARSQLLSDYMGVRRGSSGYHHGLHELLNMESFATNGEKMFARSFEIRRGEVIPLNIHFF